jgi:hypothetical protein
MSIYKNSSTSTFGYVKQGKKNIYEDAANSPEFVEVREA